MHDLRVAALGILATVLGLALAAASYPDSINVVSGSSAPLGCGRNLTSVRFRTLVVPGPSSMVTYRRLKVTAGDLAATVNETKAMTATDVVKCAKRAALAGMAGFSFNGTCTAYKFALKLCTCSPGEEVVYVANAGASSVPLSKAPYINTTVEGIGFKQYRILNFFHNVVNGKVVSTFDVIFQLWEGLVFIPQGNGSYYEISLFSLDLASCVTDSPCGLPLLVNAVYPTYYILNECGNTIPLKVSQFIMVFSHPGYGCKAFPDGPTYNCSVTFTEASSFTFHYNGENFIGSDGSCDGYKLTASYDAIKDANFCAPEHYILGSPAVTFTLRGAALAKTFKGGFVFSLFY